MVLPLMDHQTKGVEFLTAREAVALLMDRGVGKTPTVLVDLANKIKSGEVKRAIYVAPLSTLENIRRECRRFTDNLVPILLMGSRQERIRRLSSATYGNVFVINMEGVRIMLRELLSVGFDYIVCDESSRIKERTTQIARAMNMLSARAKWKRCLTGMPFTEGVEDAWSQFHFLDPTILRENYWAFRHQHCIVKTGYRWVWDAKRGKNVKKKYHTISGYKNLEEFENRIMPHVYRVAKEDCLDLPPKVYQKLYVDMTEDQRRRYATVQEEVVSQIAGHEITHAVALAKIQKLRQVAAGFLYDADHEAVPIATAKYQELQSLFLESLYGTRKVVVFTSFIAEPDMVVGAVNNLPEKRRVAAYVLPRNPTMRQETVDMWSAHKGGPAVLIANARSGGTGLNLQAADIAIFISNDWRMEDRVQAEDRIHRMGSEVFNKVTIIDILTSGTVDEDILEALQSKRDLVEVFLERIRQRQNREAGA